MVFLDIEEFRSHKMNLSSKLVGYSSNVNNITSNVYLPVNTLASHAFGVIPMDVVSGSIKTFKETSDYIMSIRFPHVIEKLSDMTINWRDINGQLLSFNGANNNSFMLRIHRSDVPPKMERPVSLPTPVPLMAKPQFNMIVYGVLVIGLLTIILMKKQ
jgi:hypothetical protein